MSKEVKPVRIQRTRQHKMVSPNGLPIVYVGRPSKWGNPFVLDKKINREEAVRLYGNYIVAENFLPYVLTELKGKNLACWCGLCEKHKNGKPYDVKCEGCLPCHADILLEMANQSL